LANTQSKLKIISVGDELVIEDACGNRWNAMALNELLTDAFADLTPQWRDILRLRLGMEDGRLRSCEEIGWLFGITGTRVQMLQSKAIKRVNDRWNRIQEDSVCPYCAGRKAGIKLSLPDVDFVGWSEHCTH
jgi:DNA-directed RNA polymerase sigma subunit (sigma70/sigma32)